jgi:hypothetical protein
MHLNSTLTRGGGKSAHTRGHQLILLDSTDAVVMPATAKAIHKKVKQVAFHCLPVFGNIRLKGRILKVFMSW